MKKLLPCGMLLLATAIGGCAYEGDDPRWHSGRGGESADTAAQGDTAYVQGDISDEGGGSIAVGLAGKDILGSATEVAIAKLNADGTTTDVGKEKVQPGGHFKVGLPAKTPGGIFIVKVLGIGGAVLGSAVLNGIPAFFKGFVIDATVDTATSFKTEIIMTLAKKGVPGIQNYLNVVNTFVDAYLSGGIAVAGAFASDFNAIFGAVADAVMAAQDALVSVFAAMGIPIDLSKLTAAEVKVISGIKGLVTTANGKLVSGAKNLVAFLQELTAKVAKPVDKVIYNAVIAASTMFHSVLGKKLPQQAGDQKAMALASRKSMMMLQSEVARDGIEGEFAKAGSSGSALDMIRQAGATFSDRIATAKSVDDLDAAKAAFQATLLGKDDDAGGGIISKIVTVLGDLKTALKNAFSAVEPLRTNLAAALGSDDVTSVGAHDALEQFDSGTKDLASKLKGATKDRDAEAMAEAIRISSKLFAQ